MAILDHFGYSTHPMEDYDDPLWYNRDDFRPWLEHIKDSKRLIIIDDSAASPKPSKPDVINKKLQVTSDKIKAKSGREVRARSYKIALCGLRWFKLNVSKYQKRRQVVKKMSSCQKDVKCQKMKHLDYGGGSQKN